MFMTELGTLRAAIIMSFMTIISQVLSLLKTYWRMTFIHVQQQERTGKTF